MDSALKNIKQLFRPLNHFRMSRYFMTFPKYFLDHYKYKKKFSSGLFVHIKRHRPVRVKGLKETKLVAVIVYSSEIIAKDEVGEHINWIEKI